MGEERRNGERREKRKEEGKTDPTRGEGDDTTFQDLLIPVLAPSSLLEP